MKTRFNRSRSAITVLSSAVKSTSRPMLADDMIAKPSPARARRTLRAARANSRLSGSKPT
jgi:hypothetical protein